MTVFLDSNIILDILLKNALNSSWKDFEDAVQHESSIQIGADYLVTRNTDDFKSSMVRIISPSEFLKNSDYIILNVLFVFCIFILINLFLEILPFLC